jgi:hypothetical protein
MKSTTGALLLVCLAWAGLGATGCGPAPIRPASYPDPNVSCPGGLISWNLDIQDRRAHPEESEKMIATVRDGVQSSFPGCHWTAGAPPEGSGAATITIIVHRLGVEEHDRYQYAAAEWTVTASTANGSTLTTFDTDEQESRPAYPDADEETLNEAFRKSLQRTVRGLAAMQQLGSTRPPEGTFLATRSAEDERAASVVTR